MARLPRRTHLPVLLLCLGLGSLLFVWQLGSTGLVDETPPLFAASARGMVERGDWLIPHVNGLPRYDKPPLVYWLMALLYALPGQAHWDPLGTWAAALPSALATIAVMLGLADTLLRWPQPPLLAPGRGAERSTISPGSGPSAGLGEQGPAAAPAPGARRQQLRLAITPLAAALAFGLCPLVLLWGRIPVSDALLSGLLSLTLLGLWRRQADPGQPWWLPWLLLGLAVLTKGPVAVVLTALTLLLFGALQGDGRALLQRLRPLPGLGLTALVCLPWYGLALLRDGRPFWDSFFGYHNLQRFSTVVNNHLQPWWYFLPVLLLTALPVTPLLLLALVRAIGPLRLPIQPPARHTDGIRRPGPRRLAARPLAADQSLARFAACWLLAVLLFFTAAATKLPSYWLPATPAAALLVALVAQVPWGTGRSLQPAGLAGSGRSGGAADAAETAAGPGPAGGGISAAATPAGGPALPDRTARIAWRLSLLLAAVVALAFAAGALWVPLIRDPELPTLPRDLLASGLLARGAWLWGAAVALGWLTRARPAPLRLLALQLPLVLAVPMMLLPGWALGDRLRSLPVRQMAASVVRFAAADEPVAMVGILKPSLHFYSRRVVIYEGSGAEGPVNLADRLRRERRPGLHPGPASRHATVLVVIDERTAASRFWLGLGQRELARAGLYRLWRLDRASLERRAAALQAQGQRISWDRPRPERY